MSIHSAVQASVDGEGADGDANAAAHRAAWALTARSAAPDDCALFVVQLILVGLLGGLAFVKSLRVIAPILMIPTVLASIPELVAAGAKPGLGWGVAAMVAPTVLLLASFQGIGPINMGVNDWDPTAPPTNWKQVLSRRQ